VAKSGPSHWQSAIVVLTYTVVSVVVIGCLYWAQSIFIPVALAVFLTFLLGPLATFLQRKGLGRVPSVLSVLALAIVLLGGLVWLATAQLTSLVAQLPQYDKNIHAKFEAVNERFEHFNRGLNRILSPRSSATPEEPSEASPPARPTPVVVKPEAPPWLSRLPQFLMPLAHILGGGGLALVLTGFMLLKREDLRNRLIHLAGQGKVTVATRALDEAGYRMSRFLIAQALISATAGASIGLGLLVIGVDYALLWGFLVFALRYIPYVGIWFAALPPVLLSFAMSDGWVQPLIVVGWIFAVEMVCANVLEPWWYGQSIGVSEVSLLVMAAFFAFLWGPIGMVLSSPLTVCLVVLGKYHPRLKFLDVLLGDEPALSPPIRFYQRLLARDQDEAWEIVEDRLKSEPAEKIIDELLTPALTYAKRDRESENLSDEDEAVILGSIREIGEELAERMDLPAPASDGPIADAAATAPPRAYLLACPAEGAEDEVAARLLEATVDPTGWEVDVLPASTLASELVVQTGEKQPDLICITALPPGGLAHTRYLCKRLRKRFPIVKIMVARWGREANSERVEEVLREAGAELFAPSLEETRKQLKVWRPVLTEGDNTPPPANNRLLQRTTV